MIVVRVWIACAATVILAVAPEHSDARTRVDREDKGTPQLKSLAEAIPAHCTGLHNIGKIALAVSNNGTMGREYNSAPDLDCFTEELIPNLEYPKRSNIQYLFGGSFWIGAVVGRDTLVSTGHDGWITTKELNPPEEPFGNLIRKSIIDPSKAEEYDGAISEQDYLAIYTDTVTEGVDADEDDNNRPHRPLGIEVTQNSYAWSYPYAEDFVLFDYRVRNIGVRPLENVFMGIYIDADVHVEGKESGWLDDVTGFIETYTNSFAECDYLDTINLAWIADNDGDLSDPAPCPAVTATRVVRTPSLNLDVSYNWWVGGGGPNDFGPRERPNTGKWKEDFRPFPSGGLGTPDGDRAKYYTMRNREFDYDQPYTGLIGETDTLWLPPIPSVADDMADGFDTRYLLSFGPFLISPGEELPVSFAYLAGEDFHTVRNNHFNLPDDPGTYYSNLDFSDLAENGRWAAWIYDNPGVDNNGDGYAGRFVTCARDSVLTDSGYVYTIIDTIYVTGDGIPDFKGASPPPAPSFWLEPTEGKMRIRFNGTRSETTIDNFSRLRDFEGYRVYQARDDRPSSFTPIESFDLENYNKWVLDQQRGIYKLVDPPFSPDSLRCLYGLSCSDTTFDPLNYTFQNPLRFTSGSVDSQCYFERQDYNVSELGVETDIVKVYPDQPFPSTLVLEDADPSELTAEGLFKYYEYYIDIPNLLPTVPYYFNITTFDFGSPASGLPALESSVSLGAKVGYASYPNDSVKAKGLEPYVYPNPYREDSDYRDGGFEGRGDDDKAQDRIRQIEFANLPPECTISIYSIDGDLIRVIEHKKPASDPTATHDEWNLVTRNEQLAVSGLYYWTIETPDGQVKIGKLVLIM